MASQFFEGSDGTRLRVLMWSGNRRPFLLVHGLSSNARTWEGVADRLADVGHQVVALDQRGHGASGKPDCGYDYPTITADLAAVIEQADLDRPIVVGQSWGGNVAIEFAAGYPNATSGAAAVDGGTIDLQARFPSWNDCWETLAPPDFAGVPRTQVGDYLRRAHPDWPREGIAATLDNFDRLEDGTVSPRLSRANHETILRSMWQRRPEAALSQLTVPALFIPAEGEAPSPDPLVDRSKMVVRPLQGDHDLHIQQPQHVARLLLEAINDGLFP